MIKKARRQEALPIVKKQRDKSGIKNVEGENEDEGICS